MLGFKISSDNVDDEIILRGTAFRSGSRRGAMQAATSSSTRTADIIRIRCWFFSGINDFSSLLSGDGTA
ncbi:MAG: hypothetical protein LBL85_06980 [Methanocalculaceae archaeon]|jgi:hypothetical protein|nr:hypothetical protein [Methanocalculaceae archaeon]